MLCGSPCSSSRPAVASTPGARKRPVDSTPGPAKRQIVATPTASKHGENLNVSKN